MKKYEECLTKEEVITSFLASKKSSDDHIQASERLSQLGHHDDALKLYLVGAQMNLIERESYMIHDFEAAVSSLKTASTLMSETSESIQGSARTIESAAGTIGEASRTMHHASETANQASGRMVNAAETINSASHRIGR